MDYSSVLQLSPLECAVVFEALLDDTALRRMATQLAHSFCLKDSYLPPYSSAHSTMFSARSVDTGHV
jgi:hypothetical protein